jgi:hypothetical protein
MKTSTKKEKEVSIKFNVAPSKHYGFINFVNLALEQGKPVTISFEKISKSGEREESKVVGTFKFEGKNVTGLRQLEEEVKDKEKRRKKQHQKRVQG